MKNELEEILVQEENCKFLTTRIEHWLSKPKIHISRINRGS